MSKLIVRLVYGALSGSVAAACMTVVRSAARRRGMIEKTVPQVVEESLAHRAGLGRNTHPVLHHLIDQAMHTGYGAALGVGYALVTRGRPGSLAARALGYGAATWLFGSWLLLPLMRAKQAPWKKGPAENVVDVVAHLVFGAATALVTEELSSQSDRGPSSYGHRRATRVG
jgi:hypothetical protein